MGLVLLVMGVLTLGGGGFAGSASAAPDPLLPVTGASEVGTVLTASPVVPTNPVSWYTCDASGDIAPGATPLDPAPATSYTLTLGDAGTYVCASEDSGLTASNPFGPVDLGPSLSASGPLGPGQLLTVTPSPGIWGDAGIPTVVWEDCDANGANCVPVASGATGDTYTVGASDTNDTIEADETADESGTTYSEITPPSGVETTAPTAPQPPSPPVNVSRPTITGTAQVGDTLTASPGTWTNNPTGYTYAWERCTGGNCTPISGATNPTYVATSADVGSVLEVLVTGAVYSSVGSAYPSFPTGQVVAAPTVSSSGSAPAPVSLGTSPAVFGRLRATVQWTFRYTPSYSQIIALSVHGATIGSRVSMQCGGAGCPFSTHSIAVTARKRCRSVSGHPCGAPKEIDLEPRFRGRELGVGARVTISISHPSFVGEYFHFLVRARRQPAVRIRCLAPGARTPGKACAGP